MQCQFLNVPQQQLGNRPVENTKKKPKKKTMSGDRSPKISYALVKQIGRRCLKQRFGHVAGNTVRQHGRNPRAAAPRGQMAQKHPAERGASGRGRVLKRQQG
jgi:hypothetical protein